MISDKPDVFRVLNGRGSKLKSLNKLKKNTSDRITGFS